jgi:hypothetical protein
MFGENPGPKREIRSEVMNMKTVGNLLVVIALTVLPLYGQHVTRHPGDILHYKVTAEGGDTSGITNIALNFWSGTTIPPNQQGLSNGFQGSCNKSSTAPNVFDCSVTIPNTVSNGDYTITWVSIGAGPNLGKRYDGDYHIPLVPIENRAAFNFPSKVTVTEQP